MSRQLWTVLAAADTALCLGSVSQVWKPGVIGAGVGAVALIVVAVRNSARWWAKDRGQW